MMELTVEDDVPRARQVYTLVIPGYDMVLFRPDEVWKDLNEKSIQSGKISDKILLLSYIAHKIEERKGVK